MGASIKDITDSFCVFAEKAGQVMNIQSDKDYNIALELMDYLFDTANDSVDSPLNPLIEILSRAIEEYENKDESIQDFVKEADLVSKSSSMLSVLMDQYKLKAADLKEEIGSPSLISMILNGQRRLTAKHSGNLSKRFGISADHFIETGFPAFSAYSQNSTDPC